MTTCLTGRLSLIMEKRFLPRSLAVLCELKHSDRHSSATKMYLCVSPGAKEVSLQRAEWGVALKVKEMRGGREQEVTE